MLAAVASGSPGRRLYCSEQQLRVWEQVILEYRLISREKCKDQEEKIMQRKTGISVLIEKKNGTETLGGKDSSQEGDHSCSCNQQHRQEIRMQVLIL